jgi:hypothetical protein
VTGVVKWSFFDHDYFLILGEGLGRHISPKNTETALLSPEHFRYIFAAVGSPVALHADT